MTTTTKAKRRNGAANTHHRGADAAHDTEHRDTSLDDAVERWQLGLAKEGLHDELTASNALLRGAQALREMQISAARSTQRAHAKAAEQLAAARSVSELSRVAMQLAQTDTEAALRYWTDWAGIAVRTGLDSWNDALGMFARAQALTQEAAQRWSDAAAAAKPETLQAQVEHVTTPLTASPLVWPAQEALREMVSLGSRPWWWAASAPEAGRPPH
jgi:hypothetical protein